MKKKKYIILSIAIICIIAIISSIIIILNNNKEENNVIAAQTTIEEREFWNDFLQESPYIAETEFIYPVYAFMDYTDMLKIALATDNVEAEEITDEEKNENVVLRKENGYKKSKKTINEYLKSLLGVEDIQYNLVETYINENEFLIEGEDYIYYTEIDLSEKIYIATNYKLEDEDYTVEIYEYIVTDKNKNELNKMLQTGEISSKIQSNNHFFIVGKKTEDNVQITYKYTNEEEVTDIDEFIESLPDDVDINEWV